MKLIGILLFALSCTVTAQESSVNYLEQGVVEGDLILTYGVVEGNPLQLRIDLDTGRARLAVTSSTRLEDQDAALDAMRNEVLKFTSSSSPVRIGNTDYRILFTNGFPFWGPSMEFSRGEEVKVLFFGNANLLPDDKLILVSGQVEPLVYDGYTKWQPRQ